MGNHTSVQSMMKILGYRCQITSNTSVLDTCNLLILPGVGAFPHAMHSLENRGLDKYIVEQSSIGKPIIGICLGMQLLTQASHENCFTQGLGVIPGKFVRLASRHHHIGWNEINLLQKDTLFKDSDAQDFYFNHSFVYQGPKEFQVCNTVIRDKPFVSVIRRNNIVGMQFHPEKSQSAGKVLLSNLIEKLVNG